ncbi:hypothetical protein ACFL5H_00090 [Candidatus Latescibacterota bacterium]
MKPLFVKSAIVTLALIGCVVSVFGQGDETVQGGQEPEGLVITAGRTESKQQEDGSFIKQYSGEVHARARSRDAELFADVAEYDSRIAEVRFSGHAVFRDSTRNLFADTLVYFERRGDVEATGNVAVVELDRSFWADRVTYLKNDRLVVAAGNVLIRDDSLRATITGTRAVFNDSTGSGIVAGNPVLVREDPQGGILTVTCRDTLEVIRPQQVARLWDGVTITQDSLVARSSYAWYEGKRDLFTLTGNPEGNHVMHDTLGDDDVMLRAVSTVRGDTIRVYLEDSEVRWVEVVGGCVSTTDWEDSTGALYSRSILESSEIRLDMADDRISMITAGGMAKSYYFQNERDDEDMFVNEATGDTLRFFFEEGRIARLRISGTGGAGARGKYYEYAPADTAAVGPAQ